MQPNNNIMNIDTQTKSFKSIYEALSTQSPKGFFIKKIAKATLKSEGTVRMWLCGKQKPDALTKNQIEKELGISASELFPSE